MSEDVIRPDFKVVPPTTDNLPQGVEAFLEAHKAVFAAADALFAPFLGKHAGIAEDYMQAITKLREAGMWVSDAVNMMLNPEMFRDPNEDKNNG